MPWDTYNADDVNRRTEEVMEVAQRARETEDWRRINRQVPRHPVTNLLQAAAASGIAPTDADLDALNLSVDERKRVAEAAATILERRAEGAFGAARSHAAEQAGEIVHRLPAEQQAADYLESPEPELTDPAELAAQVRSW